MFLATIATLLTLAEPVVPVEPLTQPAGAAALPAPAPPPATVSLLPSPPAVEAVDETEPPSPSRPSIRPGATVGLELGYARGGDRLFRLSTPTSGKSANAGDGVFINVAASWTPYWTRRGIGLGVFARAGVKFASVQIDMTSLSFLRWPLAAGGQLLLPVARRWFAVGRLGVMTEVRGRLTLSGAFQSQTLLSYSPTLGEFLDAGVCWAPTAYSGFGLIARYERLDVSYEGGPATNANNLGGLVLAILGF
jgi:hypothetical protein